MRHAGSRSHALAPAVLCAAGMLLGRAPAVRGLAADVSPAGKQAVFRHRNVEVRVSRDGMLTVNVGGREVLSGKGTAYELRVEKGRIVPRRLSSPPNPLPATSKSAGLAVVVSPAGLRDVKALAVAAPIRAAAVVRLRLPGIGLNSPVWAGYDASRNEFIGPLHETLTLQRPTAGPIFLTARMDAPVLLAYSGFETLTLTGNAAGKAVIPAGAAGELRFFAPPEPKPRVLGGFTVRGADAATTETMQTGPWVRTWIRNPGKQAATVEWTAEFALREPTARKMNALRVIATAVSARRVLLQYYGTAAPVLVRRDDGVEFLASGGMLTDDQAPPGRAVRYSFYPAVWSAKLPPPVAVAEVTTPSLPPLPPEPDVYCSDLKPLVWTSGWNGAPRRDLSIEDNPIRIRGETFAKGIGTHAKSEIVFPILSNYRRFVAVVGVDDEKNDTPSGSVTFEVRADDKLLAKTPVLTPSSERYPINVAIPKGAKRLRLLVGDGGNGIGCDHADWAMAGFIVEGEPKPEELLALWLEDGFIPVFTGGTLKGWGGDLAGWTARGNVLAGRAPAGTKAPSILWSGDFTQNAILKLRFRAIAGRAAVVVRGDGRKTGLAIVVGCGPDQAGAIETLDGTRLVPPGRYVEIGPDGKKQDRGSVAPSDAFLKQGYARPGEWHALAVRLRGMHVAVEIDGVTAAELIDARPDAPRGKRIGFALLPGSGASVEFKEVQARPLTPRYGRPIHLFNGKDLSGWTYSSDRQKKTWSVKDGVIDDTGRPPGYLRTTQDFTNYVIRVQLRHLSRGNSGVLLRMVGKDKVWPRSIECQGLYHNLGDIWNIDNFPMKTDPQRTRGRHTTKMHPTNERPLGEWNQYDITLDGGDLEIRVNGLLQNVAHDCWETPGKICLQSEGAHMQFRHITLIPILETSAKRAGKAGKR